MRHKTHQPSIMRIVRTDERAFYFVRGLIGGIGALALLAFLGSTHPIGLSMAVGLFVCSMVGLVWRVLHIQGLFSHGTEVTGTLYRVRPDWPDHSIKYRYTYLDREYKGTEHIWRLSHPLQEGEKVVMLVDPSHPNKALIRDLYI